MLDQSSVLTVFAGLIEAPDASPQDRVGRALSGLSAVLGGGQVRLYLAAEPGQFHDAAVGSGPVPSGEAAQNVAALLRGFSARLQSGQTVLATQATAPAAEAALMARASMPDCLLVPAIKAGVLVAVLWAECPEQAAAALNAREAEGGASLPGLVAVMADLVMPSHRDAPFKSAMHQVSAVFDALPELLIEMGEDGRYAGLCVGPRQLMAQAPETVFGRHFSEVLPPSAHEAVRQALVTTFETGRVEGISFALDLPQGQVTFEVSGARKEPLAPDDPPTAVFLLRDVTRRDILRYEILRLRNVVKAMSNLVIFLDLELRVTWVNPAFEQHTGWTNAEIVGCDIKELVRNEASDPAVGEALDRAMAARQPFRGQTVNKDRYGKHYWVEFNVLPLFSERGELEGWVSIETDVTPIKQQEAQTASNSQAAAAAHRRLENAVNALPDAAVVFDADERLVVSNPAFARYFPALAPHAVPGISLSDLIDRGASSGHLDAPEAGPAREAWIAQQLQNHRQDRFTAEIELSDGRWLRLVNRRTADGGLISIAIDVSIRRRQIAALDAMNHELVSVLKERDEARRRLVSIMTGAQVGTWELNVTHGIVSIGGHWAQIIGRERELEKTFPMSDLSSLVHPDDQELLRLDHVYDVEYGARPFEFEMRLRHREGHWVWVMSRGQVLRRDAEGRPELIVGVHLDISERKRLEREFETSQAHLGSAMESSIAGISLYDHQGRLLYCNAEGHRILGLVAGMLHGNRERELGWVLEHLDGRPLAPEEYPYHRARALRDTVRDIRIAARWPDGSRKILACNAAPVDAGEGLTNVVLSFWDITDQLTATENLERALAHAEEMSRAKSTFLANMSHEIRTPLNGVLGLAEVLDMQISNPAQKRMIASIRHSGETLLAVLNSILDMSKIEAGKLKLDHISFSVRDICNEILPVYAIQAEEKRLEFEVFRSAGCDIPRMGDPHRIQQILHNLLSNAIKFTDEGSVTLDLSCRAGKPLVIEITDTGTGMTRDEAARAFESFVQAEAGTTRRFGGTGLGLSIVRELVHMMGGKVTIDSAPGEGTTVRVVLPLADLAQAEEAGARYADQAVIAPPAASALAGQSDVAGLKVLGADDNGTNRDVLLGMLSQIGVNFTAAPDGRLAFELWQAAHQAGAAFDVVLLDIAMPVMDGPTTLALIRQTEQEQSLPPTRIVAVSGQLAPEAGTGQGFDGHLMKPFSLNELLNTLSQSCLTQGGPGVNV